MSQVVTLVILIETKIGCSNEQIKAFKTLAPLVLAEDGCIAYELTQVTDDENRFVLFEKWKSMDALKIHDATSHMKAADIHSASFREKPATVLFVHEV
jgi:quinol monooxygenase YgiN